MTQKIIYARDRWPAESIRRVSRKLAALHNKEAFASEIKFARSAIYRAIPNDGNDMSAQFYQAVCDKLKLDPTTGESTSRNVKFKVQRKRIPGQVFMDSDVPDELTVSEDEARLIIERRKHAVEDWFSMIAAEAELAADRLGKDPMIQSQIRRIKFEASEGARLAQSAGKKAKA